MFSSHHQNYHKHHQTSSRQINKYHFKIDQLTRTNNKMPKNKGISKIKLECHNRTINWIWRLRSTYKTLLVKFIRQTPTKKLFRITLIKIEKRMTIMLIRNLRLSLKKLWKSYALISLKWSRSITKEKKVI